MTHRWVISLAVMLCGGVTTVATAQDSSALVSVTLEEAIRRAVDVQPLTVEARGQQRTTAASERTAFGQFLPSLSTSSSASRGNTGRTDNTTGNFIPPEYSYTFGLTANLELWDGLRRVFNRRAAGASQDAADAGYTSQRFQVVLTTKQLYYDALAREELVRVAEAQVRRAQQQLQISVEKLRAGSATRSDSLRATVDYGNARIGLLQARANLASALATLGRQVGVEGPVRAVPDSVLPTLPDTALLRSSALESAPLVAQSEAQARAAGAQVWVNRAQYWPTLSVSYNTNRQGTGSPFQNFGTYPETFRWNFSLNWTLFNGFQREQAQVNAE